MGEQKKKADTEKAFYTLYTFFDILLINIEMNSLYYVCGGWWLTLLLLDDVLYYITTHQNNIKKEYASP